MRSHLILDITLSACALSACVNLAPDYTRPALPVPAQFAWGTDSPTHLQDPSLFFKDASLQALMALALQNNRDLRVAALSIDAAQAQLGVRQADLLPTFNVGLNGLRQTTLAGTTTSNYTTGLSVAAYELDLFQRLRNLSEVARGQLLASEQARQTVHISLLASVATTYLAWQSDAAQLDLTDKTLKTREESVKLLQMRFDHGASSLLDLRSAQSLLESARITRAQLQRQKQLDENALTLLVGQPLPVALRNPTSPDFRPAAIAELPVGLSSEVLLRRPDVAQAEFLLQASNASIGAARAAFFPKISLTGSLGLASNDLMRLFKSGPTAWSFTPQILEPLFDAGRNESNLKLARVNREIAQAQYEKAIQSAFKEVSDALTIRATLMEQWSAQKSLTQIELDRVKLAQLRFQQGSISYLDALDAERAGFAAQQALIQIETQYTQNMVTLYRALGGGWAPAS